MNGGVVEQLATPRELYQRPASAFVAGFIGTSNLLTVRADRREDGVVVMDLGAEERILAPDPGGSAPAIQITVRPEWIKVGADGAGPRASRVTATVADVVYLGSLTQLIVELKTGERLTVHRLNDEVGAVDPRPGEIVTLRWAAEHSFVIGSTNGSGPAAGATGGNEGIEREGQHA
jgi:spermidine/putrescine transport system ATP-binding protein